MIIKTKGYVFRTLKYGEHQLITDIFTESNGLLSFIVPGARKGGIHSKGIFLQPLSSLDLIIEVQDGKNLQKIKEIKFDRLFTNIQSDLRKGVIILFLGDVLRQSVRKMRQIKNFMILSMLIFSSWTSQPRDSPI